MQGCDRGGQFQGATGLELRVVPVLGLAPVVGGQNGYKGRRFCKMATKTVQFRISL